MNYNKKILAFACVHLTVMKNYSVPFDTFLATSVSFSPLISGKTWELVIIILVTNLMHSGTPGESDKVTHYVPIENISLYIMSQSVPMPCSQSTVSMALTQADLTDTFSDSSPTRTHHNFYQVDLFNYKKK